MAATLIQRLAGVASRFRKPVAATALALFADGDERQLVTAAPVISSGSGAPTEAATNGSLYLRTDGANADESLYQRVGGAWVPIFGQTA